MPDNSNGVNGNRFVTVTIALLSLLAGIGASVIYLGGSLRQIEVNAQRLDQIEAHGSPALRAVELEQRAARQRDEQIVSQLRSREYWEHLASQITRLETRMDYLEHPPKSSK